MLVLAAAAALLLSPDALRAALATTASALFEASPFLFAGLALPRVFRGGSAIAYLGCGCGCGPSARSLPAAAATWLAFGPAIAAARFGAAVAVALLLKASRRARGRCEPSPRSDSLLGELSALLPAALTAGAAMQLIGLADLRGLPAPALAVGGALLGFAGTPCALGAVAVAGALHVHAPWAAASFLCVAGIVDARAFACRATEHAAGHDAFAYALLALGLAIVAWRHGGELVHPAIAGALAVTASAAAVAAALHRRERDARVRFAPILMLLGALIAAPPPVYRATETTMSDLFPSERLTFTGVLSRDARATALVRYAITCCRADAAPVVVRLTRPPSYPAGTWLRVAGTIEMQAGSPSLAASNVAAVAPPTDPFIYR